MPTYTPPDFQCRVLVSKAGLLSAVGHDVTLVATQGHIGWSDDRTAVSASVDLRSLRVENAPATDAPKIARIVRNEVLHVDKHPLATLTASAAGLRLRGTLSLHGVKRELVTDVSEENGRYTCRFRLHQPDFKIVPYTAMFGTLRVEPDVTVEVSVPISR